MSSNPLLTASKLPLFSQIKPEHVLPALEQVLADNRAQLQVLLSQSGPFTWQNLMTPLDTMSTRLHDVWTPVAHLHSVLDSEALREVYDACLPVLSEYETEMGQNETLFHAIESIANGPEFAKLSIAQKTIIEHDLRDFRLSGVHLPEQLKQRYAQIQQQLSTLESKYEQNVLDATEGWYKQVPDEKMLAGLPAHAIAMAKSEAEKRNLSGYVLTLKMPLYLPVMEYVQDRSLREEMYAAYVTRASDQGPKAGQWDNSQVMLDILKARHEEALLLGFANFAEVSLATKMAKKPQQVLDFLWDLVKRARPYADQEIAHLRAFAQQVDGITEIKPWDAPYYSEKLRHQLFDFSQEQIRPYFPEDRVLQGLFDLVERLYGLKIKETKQFDSWHADARLFEIYQGDELRSQFYVDLYARDRKRGGAWMGDCKVRHIQQDNTLQIPVAFLICNFSRPVEGKPCLLTHDEVTTLFHEFGHSIHHLLTAVDYAGVSGINGVLWDAVEFPSQFMEHWCWQKEILQTISGHYQTGEPLPDALIDKMLAARNFQAALQLLRQLEFALFDFRLHLEFNINEKQQIQDILNDVRKQTAAITPVPYNRFQHAFTHVFAGGYAAGYYSYKWAEVLACDAFARFEEEGIFNPKVGQDFLHCILEQGGSQHPMDLFVKFRGREPKIDALLKYDGIVQE